MSLFGDKGLHFILGGGKHVFLPEVLVREGEDILWLLACRRPREDSRIVVEVLLRMELIKGLDNETAIVFGPAAEADIEERDMAASRVLRERRELARSKHFSIVSGSETGCLVLSHIFIGLTRVRIAVRTRYDAEPKLDARLKLLRQSFAPLKEARKNARRLTSGFAGISSRR
jgi:hypothetical protein